MIKVIPIAESVLDRGAFMPSAREITGENHVSDVDLKPGLSRLVDDLSILKDFHGGDHDLEEAVTFITFMAAGFSEDIEEFISYTRGMPHFDTIKLDKRGIRCILISGNLDQWAVATIAGCRAPSVSPIRMAFNQIYSTLTQKGLSRLFDGYRTVDQGRGVFLLEKQ